MVSSISTTTDYGRNHYKARNIGIAAAGAIIGYEAEPYIDKLLYMPIKKTILNEVRKNQGGDYTEFINKAIEQQNLKNIIKVIDLKETNAEEVKKYLNIKDRHFSPSKKLLMHILRIKNKSEQVFEKTLNGENAFFIPQKNIVVCNLDKYGLATFHEIGHALNTESKNVFTKTMSKIRHPMKTTIPIVVSMVSMTKDPKKEGEKINNVDDFIKKYCGFITTAALLPLTIDECLANIKGTKMAKEAGVTGELFKKVKHLNRMSTLSYCSSTIIAGVAVFLASKLRDAICTLKNTESTNIE